MKKVRRPSYFPAEEIKRIMAEDEGRGFTQPFIRNGGVPKKPSLGQLERDRS